MTITLTSTTKTVELNGVPARVWEGTTAAGIPVIAFIPRVAVRDDADCSEFERDLQEQAVPTAAATALPARLVL
jgi:hypothetical protein